MHVYKLNSDNHLSPQPHISPVWTNPRFHFVCPCRDIPRMCRHIQLNVCGHTHLNVILIFKKLYFCIDRPLHFRMDRMVFLEALCLASVLSLPPLAPEDGRCHVSSVSFQRLPYCPCNYYLVLTQWELTMSTILGFAFSRHPRLGGGFLWVRIELCQPREELGSAPRMVV